MMLLLVVSFLFIISDDAAAFAEPENKSQHSNEVMKACLKQYGYTVEKFDTFDFTKPAKCHSDWRIGQRTQDYAKMRAFLKEHPWYRGKNWKWEERAEYTCTKQLHNGGITVCHKPFYLN